MMRVLTIAAYTAAVVVALFTGFAVWLLIDVLTHLDDFPAKPQCIPAPQSICTSTGDVGVRI